MADPMRIRAKANGGEVEVRVLMAHEMETGQRKASDGSTVPAWFIQTVEARSNGKTVLKANWGPAISKNPFLSFSYKGGKVGDEVEITWVDNKGESRTDKAKVS